ncbi:MAG: hypothetical protein ACHQF2_07715, partial [Flavobacteriales bacterium]
CYEITRNGRINFDVKVDIEDTNPDANIVSVVVPEKCVLIIGHLSNDKYTSYNQEFINDRKFNLKTLSVEWGGNVRQVTPSTFDSHFTKVRGTIRLLVK